MWRTAGTPLYPLFQGHLTRGESGGQYLSGVADLAEHVYHLVRAGPYIWVALGVLGVALVTRKILPDATLVVVAAATVAVVTVVFAANTPFVPATTFIRYVGPMTGALAVFLLSEMLRGMDARERRVATPASRNVALVMVVAAAALLVGIGYSALGFEFAATVSSARTNSGALLVIRAAKNQLAPPPGEAVSSPELRVAFRRALRGVEPERTIAAVDRPYLIDYSRYDIQSLDAPGYMTPDGRGSRSSAARRQRSSVCERLDSTR